MVTWTISFHSSWAKMAANVQSLVQYWKKFDLPGLQKELDVTATELANRQDESETSRKKLVELSRDFKRTTEEDVRRLVAPLLKSFQSEVDSLSKRSKSAEGAFLAIYKKLVECPDPVPVLESCHAAQQRVQRAQDLEIENKQLRETLNEYNEEFKDVRNQEVTIKQLREKLREYEDKIENTAKAKAHEFERDLQKAFVEKERHLEETQIVLSKKFEEAERRISELQSALECTQTELFDLKAKYDEDSHAKSDEMEIVVNDLERANQRAAAAEKEVLQLKEQLSKHSSGLGEQAKRSLDMDQSTDNMNRSSMEIELSAKEKEIAQLVEDIQRLQFTITTLKETSASQIAQLETMLTEKNRIIQKLEDRLDEQKDYQEIKQELQILKSMEFPEGDQDSGNLKTKPLEVLLLEKTKSLQSENTALKVSTTEASGRRKHLERENAKLEALVGEQKSMIIQLEEDLARVNTMARLYRNEDMMQQEGSSFPPDLIGELTDGLSSPTPGQDSSGAAETLLPIISRQRERFRQRNQELEAENSQLQQQVLTYESTVGNLRSDNVKLYEKIKFLQSYPAQQSIQVDDMESRYSKQYEEKLNPFSNFSQRERQRKYMNLSPFEKVTLSLGQTILSSRLARSFALFYTVLLHCLVFLVLYKMAYTETCRRDLAADCHAKFADHMQLVHGDLVDPST